MYFGTRPYLHEELYGLLEGSEGLSRLLNGPELVHASFAIPQALPYASYQ